MKRIPIFILIMSLFFTLSAKEYSVQSPSGKIEIKVAVGETTTYSVLLNGTEIIVPSTISRNNFV